MTAKSRLRPRVRRTLNGPDGIDEAAWNTAAAVPLAVPQTHCRGVDVGMQLAARFFEQRGRDRVEVHLNQTDLAALLALAFELGCESTTTR